MNGGVLVAAAVLTSSGSCLYTDPINMPPSVQINHPLEPVWRGEQVTLTATVNDPDSDPYTLEWTSVGGSCPPDQNASADSRMWPRDQRVPGRMFEIPPSATQTQFCAWAFATDRHGAVRAADLQVDPKDHAPVAGIEIVESVSTVAGFSLYARLKFSGESSADADQDQLSYHWTLSRKPPGSTAESTSCPDETTDKFACLSPDLPGDYEIQLTVADGMNLGAMPISGTAKRMVSVASDQLPCLTLTSPMFSSSDPAPAFDWDPEQPKLLSVTEVKDDGDPYPAQQPLGIHFSWFMGSGTTPLRYLGNDQPFYVVPDDLFTIGDIVTIRVEIRDRKPDAVDAALAGCTDDQDLCYGQGRVDCAQRVTWRIKY